MVLRILRCLGAALCLAFVGVAAAQTLDFTIGERIEYKDRLYPETWLPGTVVRLAPASRQVIVRWDPRDDYPSYTHNGVSNYEQAYALDAVRHAGVHAAAAGGNAGIAAPATAPAATPTAPVPPPSTTGGAPLSKSEILAYMRSYGYAGAQPRKDLAVCRALVAQIKARGVVAALEPGKDDVAPYNDNGCAATQDTDVVGATRANIGAPVGVDWLAGTWVLYVIGGTVDFAGNDGWIYRQNESIAKLGFVTIGADGSYEWKVDPTDTPDKYLHGRWRRATSVEMNVQGGAGVVLQHGAGGADWIAFKYMDPSNAAERIELEHLQSRGAYRRIGWRRK